MNDFLVVYSAEFMRRVKSRPFQIGMLIGVLGIVAFTKLPAFISGLGDHPTNVVIAGASSIVQRAKPLLAHDYTIVATTDASAAPTAASLKQYRADAWIAIQQHGILSVTVYAKDPSRYWSRISDRLAPLNLAIATRLSQARATALMSVPVDVKAVGGYFSSAKDADAALGIAGTLLFFLYMLILLNSQFVMSAVAEEKTSRIAELLIASISPIPLLYGKIAAAATLALLQLAVWLVVGIALGTSGAHSARTIDASAILSGGLSTTEMVAFLVLFILGFLQVSMLFAGLASLVNRTEDLGSVSMPLVMPIVGAFLLSFGALQSPDLPWVVITSFVPILSPFMMFARTAVSSVPVWQIVLCVAINLATLWFVALIAGKLYRVGMLLYGRAPNLKQVWAVLRS